MPRLLFIVAREEPELYDYIRREFDDSAGDVEVIVDRRRARPRRGAADHAREARPVPERRRTPPDERLRALGWTIVGCG